MGKALGSLLNSSSLAAFRRAVMSRMPFPILDSNVANVVYATWLVDADIAAAYAPAGAKLWVREGRTPLTILSYRHGHFGPRLVGPLRRLMPSPLQSNWRLYLSEPLPGAPDLPTVAFVHNAMDSLAHVIGTRLFSDALPSHWPARFELSVSDNIARVDIEPGSGSAQRLAMTLRRHGRPDLPQAWKGFFDNWRQAVAELASQEAAVVEVAMPMKSPPRTALARINLPVDVDLVEPLQLDAAGLDCPLLDAMNADSDALCFLLPQVDFSALSEALLPAAG
jgi:hypothetical protein